MALKYVVGVPTSKYGHFDTTLIDVGDATRIRSLLDRVIEVHSGSDEEDWAQANREYLQEMTIYPPDGTHSDVLKEEGGS